MFHIDPADPTPVEAQLVRTIRSAIGAGVLEAGDELPTVRQLAVDLRVSANAVERAYAELGRLGAVRTRPGVGVFVAPTDTPDAEVLEAELTALEDSFIRRTSELGFSLDDVIIHLSGRRPTLR